MLMIFGETLSVIYGCSQMFVIYRKTMDSSDIDKLQTDLNRLGEWTVGNEMKISRGKSKAVRFTKATMKERIRYYFGDQLIPEASSFKYLGIIIRGDLNWADSVNYTPRKAWKALHFIKRILKKVNNNTKLLAYPAIVRPILECRAVCWDPSREGQVSALNRVQKRAAKFANINESGLETLAQRKLTARIRILFKSHTRRRA